MEKPIAYNYVKAEEEIKRLKEKVANLEIRCRIAEENKPEWIPVSERLPEPSSELLLVSGYIKTGDIKTFATDIARWNGDNWTFEGKPMPDVPILAWMPLPEPYKEGTNE